MTIIVSLKRPYRAKGLDFVFEFIVYADRDSPTIYDIYSSKF